MEIIVREFKIINLEFVTGILQSEIIAIEDQNFELIFDKNEEHYIFTVSVIATIPNIQEAFVININCTCLYKINTSNSNPTKMELFSLYALSILEAKTEINKELKRRNSTLVIDWNPHNLEVIESKLSKAIEIAENQNAKLSIIDF